MSTYIYTTLPGQAQEDALHANRLLQVEERPFERVRKRILHPDALIQGIPPKQLPSPPPDNEDADPNPEDNQDEQARRVKYREDILLDFAAVESSILRIQLIQASNARERERYATEKAKILETAQAVKNNTLELRAQLVEAQRLLEFRKGYDELAAKLIDPKRLKSRAETQEDIEKLEKEIEDLQQESADYENVWIGRREAFDRVVNEGENMIKVIKGIKDEPDPEIDKDDRMEDGDEGGRSVKHQRSRVGTPAPGAGGRTPIPDGRTPMRGTAVHTPREDTNLADDETGMRPSSLATSPVLRAQEDVDMVEGHQLAAPILTETEAERDSEPQPVQSLEMELTSDQVSTPAETIEGDEGQRDIDEGLGEENAPALVDDMDET